jgi:hypothetical protein
MAIVYKHIRLDTKEVFYIGIGIDLNRPYSRKNRNIHWHRIVNKVGYIVEIMYENIDWNTACNIEIGLIKQYGRRDLKTGSLVNMTDGGDGNAGMIITEEHRAKLSKSHIGIHAGDKHPLYGKPVSTETRKKLSIANSGKKFSIEHRQKIGIANSKRKLSQETRNKISNSHIGQKQSEETKQKYRDARRGRRWMVRDGIQTQVMKCNIEDYINNGWKFGTLKSIKS